MRTSVEVFQIPPGFLWCSTVHRSLDLMLSVSSLHHCYIIARGSTSNSNQNDRQHLRNIIRDFGYISLHKRVPFGHN